VANVALVVSSFTDLSLRDGLNKTVAGIHKAASATVNGRLEFSVQTFEPQSREDVENIFITQDRFVAVMDLTFSVTLSSHIALAGERLEVPILNFD
jgi:hypothetical protein